MGESSEASAAAMDEAGGLVLKGRAAGKLLPGPLRVLFAVTGVTLLVSLGKLFGRLLGWKRQGRLVLRSEELSVEETTRFAGREMNSSKETFGRPDVVSARLETRYPYLPTLLGLASLGIGVVVGLIWLLDGIQGEFVPWILAGVGVLLLGIVLDVVLTAVASSMPGTTTVVLRLPEKRVMRLIGCDPEQAEQVVLWLHEHSA